LVKFKLRKESKETQKNADDKPATTQEEKESYRNLDLSSFETFSIYKFSIEYPPVCRVEFNPKSRRDAGDIVFHFPDREKMFLSWGNLEKAEKKFATAEEQAEHSFKAVKKSSNVKKIDKVTSDVLSVNSHNAAYNRVRVDEIPRGLFGGKTTIPHEAHSLHLHCDKSSRYFVLYTMLSPRAPEDFGDLFVQMAKSFKCH
jgi:hypothetical protein